MQGASPLASPGLYPGAALAEPAVQETEGGAQGGGRLPTLPLWYPAGGLAFFVARLPFYFSLFPAPIPPTPFPSGEGGAQKFISPGAPPPAPRRRAAYGTYRDCRTSALRRETCGSPQERRQTVAHSFASAARVQPRGCKGLRPLHKITLSLPLPAGKGVGGMGA